MALAALSFDLNGDASGFVKAADDVGRQLKKMEQGLQSMRNAAAIAGGALVAFMGKAVKEASELEQTELRVRTAFKQNADAINAWADTAGRALGRSNDTMLALASSARLASGSLFGNEAQATAAATSFAQLSVAMEKVSGVPAAQALDALNAALSGSTRGLKQFGVVITENMLALEMERHGIQGKTSDLTDAQKATLTYNIIMRESARIQEGAAKSGTTFRESITRLDESVNDAFQSIGTALIPAVKGAADAMRDAVDWFNRLPESTKEVIAQVALVSAGIAALVASVSGLILLLPQLAGGFKIFVTLVPMVGALLAPLLAIAAVLAALVFAIGFVRKVWVNNVGGIRDETVAVFQTIKGWFEQVPQWARMVLEAWVSMWLDRLKVVRDLLVSVLPEALAGKLPDIPAPKVLIDKIQLEFKDATEQAAKKSSEVVGVIGDVFGEGLKTVKQFGVDLLESTGVLQAFTPAAKSAAEAIPAMTKQLAPAVAAAKMEFDEVTVSAGAATMQFDEMTVIADTASTAMATFQGIAAAAGQAFLSAVPKLNALVSAATKGAEVGGVWGAIIAAIVQLVADTEAFGRIIATFEEGLAMLGDAFAPIFDLIADLIASTQPTVEALSGLIDMIVNVISPIFSMLQQVIDPLVGIIKTIVGVIGDVLGPLLRSIISTLRPLFQIIGKVLEFVGSLVEVIGGLVSIFGDLSSGFEGMFDVISKVLEPVIIVLGMALKGIALIIAGIIRGLVGLWNGIVDAIASLFREIAKFDVAGAKPFAFLNGWADTVQKARANTTNLDNTINKLVKGLEKDVETLKKWDINTRETTKSQKNLGKESDKLADVGASSAPPIDQLGDSAKETAKENKKAQDEFTKTVQEVGESLTNIPQGFKVELARFQALDPSARQLPGGGLEHFATGGIVTRPTLAMIGESGPEMILPLGAGGGGGGGINIYGPITVVSNDPEGVWDEIRRVARRESFLKTGASVMSAPQWVGG